MYECMYDNIQRYVIMYVCTCLRTYVCMYVRAYVRTYVCMYVPTYVRTYVCMYVRMYACMYYACIHVYWLYTVITYRSIKICVDGFLVVSLFLIARNKIFINAAD